MCYYNSNKITQTKNISFAGTEMSIEEHQELTNIAMGNGFNYGDWLIVIPDGGTYKLEAAHWEFLSPWSKTMKEVIESRKKYNTLNAVGEKMLESKMYQKAAVKRRCLVISTGFYEWQHIQKKTYPFHIGVAEKEYFMIGGIYQPWTDKETGETFNTFALVTTAANPLMERIHNTKKRMPLILTEDIALDWMKVSLDEKQIKEIASYQFNADEMKAHTIRKDFKDYTILNFDPKEPYNYPEINNSELPF